MKLLVAATSAVLASLLVLYKKRTRTRRKRTHVAHADQDIFHQKLVWICDHCKKCILGILYFQEDHALCETCFSTLPDPVKHTFFKSRVYISRELALKGTLQMLKEIFPHEPTLDESKAWKSLSVWEHALVYLAYLSSEESRQHLNSILAEQITNWLPIIKQLRNLIEDHIQSKLAHAVLLCHVQRWKQVQHLDLGIEFEIPCTWETQVFVSEPDSVEKIFLVPQGGIGHTTRVPSWETKLLPGPNDVVLHDLKPALLRYLENRMNVSMNQAQILAETTYNQMLVLELLVTTGHSQAVHGWFALKIANNRMYVFVYTETESVFDSETIWRLLKSTNIVAAQNSDWRFGIRQGMVEMALPNCVYSPKIKWTKQLQHPVLFHGVAVKEVLQGQNAEAILSMHAQIVTDKNIVTQQGQQSELLLTKLGVQSKIHTFESKHLLFSPPQSGGGPYQVVQAVFDYQGKTYMFTVQGALHMQSLGDMAKNCISSIQLYTQSLTSIPKIVYEHRKQQFEIECFSNRIMTFSSGSFDAEDMLSKSFLWFSSDDMFTRVSCQWFSEKIRNATHLETLVKQRVQHEANQERVAITFQEQHRKVIHVKSSTLPVEGVQLSYVFQRPDHDATNIMLWCFQKPNSFDDNQAFLITSSSLPSAKNKLSPDEFVQEAIKSHSSFVFSRPCSSYVQTFVNLRAQQVGRNFTDIQICTS